MENRSLREFAKASYGIADKLTVVVVEDFDPSITVSDLQGAVTGTGALGWDVHFDATSLMTTLEAKFDNEKRAESFFARFNRLVDESDGMRLNTLAIMDTTSNDSRSSPTDAASTTGRAYTPSSTTGGGLSETASTVGLGLLPDDVPWPGKTYKIHHRESRRVIMLEEGILRLKHPEAITAVGGWHWTCTEKDGWLGFRSPVSAQYMGHSNNGGIGATRQQHGDSEYFCVRRHPDGGYVILSRAHYTKRPVKGPLYLGEPSQPAVVLYDLRQVTVNKSGKLCAISKGGNMGGTDVDTQWLFEEI